jgi:hypothetical protein
LNSQSLTLTYMLKLNILYNKIKPVRRRGGGRRGGGRRAFRPSSF